MISAALERARASIDTHDPEIAIQELETALAELQPSIKANARAIRRSGGSRPCSPRCTIRSASRSAPGGWPSWRTAMRSRPVPRCRGPRRRPGRSPGRPLAQVRARQHRTQSLALRLAGGGRGPRSPGRPLAQVRARQHRTQSLAPALTAGGRGPRSPGRPLAQVRARQHRTQSLAPALTAGGRGPRSPGRRSRRFARGSIGRSRWRLCSPPAAEVHDVGARGAEPVRRDRKAGGREPRANGSSGSSDHTASTPPCASAARLRSSATRP